MKETKNNQQDYLDAIKGNGLIIGIILLNVLLLISLNMNVYLNKINLLKQEDISSMVKLK